MNKRKRRLFPAPEIQPPFKTESRMLVSFPGFRMRFSVEGRLSMRQRRAVLLTVLREIRPRLKRVIECHIYHTDAHPMTRIHAHGLTPSLLQAPHVSTTQGKTGLLVRMRRLELGWTQDELGKKAGISQWQLGRIETGSVTPRELTLSRLEKALGLGIPKFPGDQQSIPSRKPLGHEEDELLDIAED